MQPTTLEHGSYYYVNIGGRYHLGQYYIKDVPNYFLWRQQDYKRNAIGMAARAVFSHKECLDKNTDMLLLMMETNGIKFHEKYSNRERFGYFVSGSERLSEIGNTNYKELNDLITKLRMEPEDVENKS